ncbi:MAG: pyruvate dehydrogenase (acetyl-transferring) E1 component subunit alpha [Sphingobacteriales bacterium]|nr:pyruvate dehydrogenase (acetyl-transferring) E1 component subunit alpha [Sphingobacteriales bacterium]
MPQPKITKQMYLEWYESMLRQRRFEERAGMLYGQEKIRGFCHLYIGQEAVSTGIVAALNDNDPIITAYRDHGFALARGISSDACMAELYGKATGCSKGKGGSMHFFSKEKHFYGGHGIVGAQIPMGAGIAFADKYLNTGRVTVCLFGDGAARQGALHETFNLAMMWQLPVIFVVENNMYAMGTSVARSSNVTDISSLSKAYDMPSAIVDGMDCDDVFFAVHEAAQRARSGGGPTFLEIKTYRYKGHSMSDPQKYRSKEEVAKYKADDPIDHVLDIIRKKKYADEAWIESVEQKIQAEIDQCVRFAEESPFPEAAELYQDVYLQADYPYLTD